MPDPLLWGKAFALAALVSAALTFLARWIVRTPADDGESRLSGPIVIAAIGAGFAAGCWLLRLPTSWKPTGALDRFLVIVFPATVAAEFIAAGSLLSRRLAWLPRIVLAGATGRLLLHGSVYLAGPHREWTGPETTAVLAGSAAALTATWWLLTAMQQRRPDAAVPLSLSMTLIGYFLGRIPGVKEHFEVVILVVIFLSILPGIIAALKEWRKGKRAVAIPPPPA